MNTRQQVGLFFALFFAYLVVGSREPPWNDARQIYKVAESLVHNGTVHVDVKTHVVREGRFYAAHPLLTSLLHVPGAALEKVTSKRWPRVSSEMRALASHIGPAAVAAGLGVLFFRLCLALGASLAAARLGTAVCCLGTMVVIYARSPYSEIAQTAAYTGFFAALVAWLDRPSHRRALGFGIACAVLCNTKLIFVLTLPGAAVLAALRLRGTRDWRAVLRHAGMAAVGGLPGVVLLLAYNHARTGSIFQTGYPAEQIGGREFGEWTAIGLWGLFFSLGKSVFLYSPPLIAAAFALPHALRSRPRLWFVALLATAGPVLLFYGRFTFWHGDWAWGPRYTLFATPVALLPLVFAYDDLRLARRSLARATATLVLTAGLAVQVLGGAFYWDHYIRVARDAQTQWLGAAQRSGATTPDTGNDCGPCIEDMYGLNWLPAFQPIEGHLWLLRNKARERTAEDAEARAPWHRYTSLKLNVTNPYGRARIDWWLFDWKPPRRAAGVTLLLLFVAGMLAGATLWLRTPRPSTQPSRRWSGLWPRTRGPGAARQAPLTG